MSEPTPAASRPGTSTSPSMAPPIPDASISRKAPSNGEPNSVLIAAKLPAAATTARGLGRSVPLDEPDGADGRPAAERDQRRLGAQHHAEAQGGECRERHPGKLDRPAGPARLEPVRRRVAARTRQVADGERDQQTGQDKRRDRPPQRLAVEAKPAGQVGEDPRLQLGDQGEETVSHRRDGHADDRGEYQQLPGSCRDRRSASGSGGVVTKFLPGIAGSHGIRVLCSRSPLGGGGRVTWDG